MSDYTFPYPDENTRQGVTPRWFVTRRKYKCINNECPSGELGTSTDHGYDPAIDSFSTSTSGTTGICNFPTHRDWSSGVNTMSFFVKVDTNTTADLGVNLVFYEGVYGDSGDIERWRHIVTCPTLYDDQAVSIASDGGQILCHIASYVNDDAQASLKIYARRGSATTSFGGGGGGGADSEVGSNVVGVKGWYATTRNWLGILVDGSGRVVTSSGAAIAGYVKKISDEVTTGDGLKVMQDDASKLLNTELNSTTILARLTSLVTTIGNHGVATDTEGIRVLGVADSTTPTAVGDGEDVHPWNNLVGARGVFQTQGSDHTTSSISTFEEPGSGIDSVIKDCAAADTAYALVAASTPCIGVFLSAAQANAGQARFGDSAIAAVATGGAYIPHDDVSAPVWVSIDDAAKLYVSASNNGDDVIATIITR